MCDLSLGLFEPRHEKTNNVVFEQVRHKPSCTLEAANFGFRKYLGIVLSV